MRIVRESCLQPAFDFGEGVAPKRNAVALIILISLFVVQRMRKRYGPGVLAEKMDLVHAIRERFSHEVCGSHMARQVLITRLL